MKVFTSFTDSISLLPTTLPKSKEDLDIAISASNSKFEHDSEGDRTLGKHISEDEHISEEEKQMERKEHKYSTNTQPRFFSALFYSVVHEQV